MLVAENSETNTMAMRSARAKTFAASMALLLAAIGSLPIASAAPAVGKPAPPLVATLLDGTPFDLAAHRGEVIVINFWATWCEPCRTELPAFETYYREHRKDGFTLLAVSMDDPELRSRVMKVAQDYSFPVSVVGDTQASGYGRIWRLPITFVIDRHGVLRVDGGSGERQAYDLPAFAHALDPLLAEQRP